MKPKDLKRLFTFEERRPLLADGVFYVPFYYTGYENYAFPPLFELFGNDHPTCIEYCSGNGDWILEKAKQNREKNWIAVEKRFDRVRKIWSKTKNDYISNLFIVCGEAFTFTRFYLLNDTIEEAYINFPDPWPKPKHAKNRLIQPLFLDELSRILRQDKKITFVTDDSIYLEEAIQHFRRHAHFSPFFPAPYYKLDVSSYGTSWFENLWREKGKQIHYTQFYKNETPN